MVPLSDLILETSGNRSKKKSGPRVRHNIFKLTMERENGIGEDRNRHRGDRTENSTH